MKLTPEQHAAAVSRANIQRRAHEKLAGTQCGPVTDTGKAASALRGLKHGCRSVGVEALEMWIASVNRLTRAIEKL